MLYRVIKAAFDSAFIAEIETIVADLPQEKGATVENDDYSTRQCDLRWITYGTPGFALAQDRIFAVLRDERIDAPGEWALENLQYTAYGPNGFHNWHIDAYRRSYNKYDLSLDPRFIGKKRALSVSILLNGGDAFTGGAFEVSLFPNGRNTVGSAIEGFSDAGDMAVFDSGLCHRVAPVASGLRKSLVAWICA
ncbi:MAG: 2OG-Fe(II) oxygenase [Alphaproteobacteria bacterium]|nr:2OG-Fe(II) oxygenase [Alphaproteobacteria bacterium]